MRARWPPVAAAPASSATTCRPRWIPLASHAVAPVRPPEVYALPTRCRQRGAPINVGIRWGGRAGNARFLHVKHHLIVAHEVTNVGHDRTQLFAMATQARSATGKEDLTVVADRGYFKGEEILDCAQAGMTPLVPKPLTSNSKADGRFDKRDFVYIAEDDQYRCPAGQRAIK